MLPAAALCRSVTLTCAFRGLSEAKKAFLYNTSVELGEAEGDAAADEAAVKVLSQMKQLELSGTAGSFLLAAEEAEVLICSPRLPLLL